MPPPREVVFGAIAICIQLLYSLAYPYVLQGWQSLPELDTGIERALSGMASEAGWTRQTAAASTGQRIPREEAVERALQQIMIKHMSSMAHGFKVSSEVAVTPTPGVEISWDVHRVTDANVPFAYFFRVRLKNVSPRPCSLQGIARFYVLRGPNDKVFPVHRVTEGPAGFTLGKGEEYKYAWIFTTKYQTLDMAGGYLLENRTHQAGGIGQRFFNATLEPLKPARAIEVSSEDLEDMIEGHHFMGSLDLRSVEYH